MKLIETKIPNVYGVKVPSDAIFFDEELHKPIGCDTFRIGYKTISGGCFSMETESKDNFRVLGFLTKDEISFDASEVVHCYSKPLGLYKNYKVDTGYVEHLCNSEQSFRSALPEYIYFENPFKNPDLHNQYVKGKMIICDESDRKFVKDCEQYQTAQENITEKLLILKRITDNVKI